MKVFHGSTIEITAPDINYGRFNLDFGKGFYVTTLKEQAEKWAKRKTKLKNRGLQQKTPIVNVYEFDFSGLNILSFEEYTEEWLDFVVANRIQKDFPHKYDAIFGNIADDDVAATVDGYMRLLRRNRVNHDVKNATIFQLTFEPPNNQYCIATPTGIARLSFEKCYELEG